MKQAISKMPNCSICNTSTTISFTATLLHQYKVQYYQCSKCGFLQTEVPYWLNQAYGNAIADADTGLVQRNISIASKLSVLFYFEFQPKASYLDIAGGYGMLTRLMRDVGFDFYWSDKYCQNLLAKGFEVEKAKPETKFSVLTAFEVLEHVHDPMTFIKETMKKYNTSTLILSTELFEGIAPPKDWWYYTFNTGQHISFYQAKTLHFIAKQLGLNFYSSHGLHIFTYKKINKFKYFILTSRFTHIIAPFVKHKMHSKTFTDHQALMDSNENNI